MNWHHYCLIAFIEHFTTPDSMLLLLSRFSHVWLTCSPPGSSLHGIFQAKVLEWAAIAFSNAWKWKVKSKSLSRVRLCATPGSPPGSPIPGILQARTLEWAAIAFSNAWKWKAQVKSLSHVRLLTTPWIAAHQALLSMGFSRQEYLSRVPLPSPQSLKKIHLNQF